jgi:hypothetical protein
MMNRNTYLAPMAPCAALAMAACGSGAQINIAVLQDEPAWKTAQDGNSLDSYRDYLHSMLTGTHAQAARERITGLERAAAWKAAQSGGTSSAIQSFLQKHPQGPDADQARQTLAMLTGEYRTNTAPRAMPGPPKRSAPY